MYIQLMHRHHGVHEPIKHIEIDVPFEKVYLGEDNINEELLLNHIPEEFLITKPSQTLLAVGNKNYTVGQSNLSKFLSWAKYFDAYVLELHKEPLSWWKDDNKNTFDKEGETDEKLCRNFYLLV